MKNTQDLSANFVKAIVVGVVRSGEDSLSVVEMDLDEMCRLLDTLGVKVAHRMTQKRDRLSSGFLLGGGKIDELKSLAENHKAKLIVIDHPLSGVQIKNLEQATCCSVIDRTTVILEIFSKHAKTKESKTQVEIAQLEYMLPRMVGQWTHFVRQKGGGVTVRGMGETQIEVDRRHARKRISRLHKKLESIRVERDTQRKLRSNEIKVSLVGYTNSGKTTLMNNMTHCPIKGEDRLFATLDSSTRVIDPRLRPNILLSDTVGFIRKLPSGLVESFKSTLEEVLRANLILHVVDVSADNYNLQIETTDNVLKEIGACDIPAVLVFNKIDQLDDSLLLKLLKKRYPTAVFVSAMDLNDSFRVRETIFQFFKDQFCEWSLRIPYDDTKAWSLLHRSCVILDASYDNAAYAVFRVKAVPHILSQLSSYKIVTNFEEGYVDGL